MSKLSPLVDTISVSKTIEIHALTKAIELTGEKVYSLCVGEPDYEPPAEVIDATSQAVNKGHTKYTTVTGTQTLRAAISQDLLARKGTMYSPEQIVVSNGAKQAVLQGLLAVVAPGEKVLIPVPYWTSYPDMVKLCHATPVIIPTLASEQYALTAEALRSALQAHPEVACLILCNPSNPSGCVATAQQMEAVADVLREYPNVWVLSDEIYERLTYDSTKHTSFATLPGMYERTITINGFSKSHAMTGFRIGYSASSLPVARAIGKLQSQITSCASSVAQHAACEALQRMPQSNPGWFAARVAELQAKRDVAFGILQSIPHVLCPTAQGAFYLLPDVSYYFGKRVPQSGEVVSNSHELCLLLLKIEKVALVPGDAFGVPDCVRLSYATSTDVIVEALERLRKFLLYLE